MSLISLVRADRYSDLKTAIEKSVDLVGFKLPSNLRRIVVKPNLCFYWHCSTGHTTDPNFVAGLIDFLRESLSSNLEICVVESDSSAMKCRYSFKFLGYEKMAKEKKITLVNLTEDKSEEIKVKIANRSYTFSLPNTIKNAELFINVPKMKYLGAKAKMTCALKNIFGCNPDPKKFKYHGYLDEAIVGLNRIMKPNLCLVDGIVVRGKCTKKLGLVMASTDPVATDSVVAKIIGLNPKKIGHVVLAENERLGQMKYKAVGESIQYFAKLFPRRTIKDRMRSTIVSLGLSTLRKLGLIPVHPY